MNKVLAIIPARGGSKRIPDKNIKLLAGEPLISYTVNASLNSTYIDRTVVSSDNEKILIISKSLGADVVLRPKELARDDTPTIPVITNVVKMLNKKENYNPNIVILLQPTSPLRTSTHIDEAFKKFFQHNPDMLVSVKKTKVLPQWLLQIKNGSLVFYEENNFKIIRSQDRKGFYIINGAIYIYKTNLIRGSKDYAWSAKTIPYLMDEKDSLDIDTYYDFKVAECILKYRGF